MIFSSAAVPEGSTRTGLRIPQTKAEGSPSASTPRQLLRSYFLHTSFISDEFASERGAAADMSRLSLKNDIRYMSRLTKTPMAYMTKSQSVMLRGTEEIIGSSHGLFSGTNA